MIAVLRMNTLKSLEPVRNNNVNGYCSLETKYTSNCTSLNLNEHIYLPDLNICKLGPNRDICLIKDTYVGASLCINISTSPTNLHFLLIEPQTIYYVPNLFIT